VTGDRSVVFSGTPVSSTNKSDHHDITEILLKMTLNTIILTLTPKIIDRVKLVLLDQNSPLNAMMLVFSIVSKMLILTYNRMSSIVVRNTEY
jgi:hypothetical protein